MKDLDLRNTCIAVYTPEVISQAGVEDAVAQCKQTTGVLSLEVHVLAQLSVEYRQMLERLNFVIGGTATKGTDVFVIYRLTIRSAGDGLNNPDLAVRAPVLAPSDVEKQAIALMEQRYSPEQIERRVALYKAGLL